ASSTDMSATGAGSAGLTMRALRFAAVAVAAAAWRHRTATTARPIHHRRPGLALLLEVIDPRPNRGRSSEAAPADDEGRQVARVDRVMDYRHRLAGRIGDVLEGQLESLHLPSPHMRRDLRR